MPVPGGGDDIIQIGILGFPAQLLNSFFIGGNQHRRVARSAIRIYNGNIFCGDFAGVLDDLQHGEPINVAGPGYGPGPDR